MNIATLLIAVALVLGIVQFARSQASDLTALGVCLIAAALLLTHYA